MQPRPLHLDISLHSARTKLELTGNHSRQPAVFFSLSAGWLAGSLDVLAAGDQLLLPVDLRQQLVHHVQLLQERERHNHDMSSRFLDFAIFPATFWMQTML